ncbi:MAG TPA: type 4a pilus biogenesis protein PilO [Polyangiaceae bacterium]|nr:type 4a pilus biogenesis protein PilO [Polyangiaceae bacterium]
MARGDSVLAKLPPVAKLGVGVLFVALIGVAYFVVFYGDLQSSITAEQSTETKLRAELSAARKNEFSYQQDLAELSDRQQRQREQVKILPTETEYPAFLSAVQNVANVSGIGLTAWSPLPEVPDQFYSRVPMKVELRGRYHQVAKFFHGVGQLDRVINMENISLTDPKDEGEDMVVKVEALATAFRAKPEATDTGETTDKRGAKQGTP